MSEEHPPAVSELEGLFLYLSEEKEFITRSELEQELETLRQYVLLEVGQMLRKATGRDLSIELGEDGEPHLLTSSERARRDDMRFREMEETE